MSSNTNDQEILGSMYKNQERENSNEETKKNSKELIDMYQEEETTVNDLIFKSLKPVRYWQAANYVLLQYSDSPHSNLVQDHCREEALLIFATMMCRSHVGKTQESLYKDLLKANEIYLENPMDDHDVYEIAERIFSREQEIRQEVFTEDEAISLFFNSKIDFIE